MRASTSTDVQPFKAIPCEVSPVTYSNNSYGVEQLLIDGGTNIELQISDGTGGSITIRNTNAVLLRPFSSVAISYLIAPVAVKVMVI